MSVQRPGLGIVLIVLMSACFAVMDTTVKYLGAFVPILLVLWCRYAFQALAMAAWLARARHRPGGAGFRAAHPRFQAVRGLLLLATSALGFFGVQHLPVAEFTTINMLTPVIVTLLAAWLLHERVSALRWALVAGGFSGAMVVIRPGADDFQWAMLMPLSLVAVNAAFQLLTSKLVKVDDAGTMHFYTGVVATLAASLALPFAWQAPQQPWLWGVLLLLGVFSTLGHFLLILAYGRAGPATLTPYLYTQIGFATLAGWLVFSHRPDGWSLTGIGIIAVCGVLGTWLTEREHRLAGRPAPPVESRAFQ